MRRTPFATNPSDVVALTVPELRASWTCVGPFLLMPSVDALSMTPTGLSSGGHFDHS
jgi:hypothetical protein